MEIYISDIEKEVPYYDLDSHYKYINNIAKGSFGTVIHVLDTNTEEELAIKIINKSGSNSNSIQKMKKEITILKQLKHENIVQFYGYEETNSKLYIMMEYLKYGTLSEYMKKNKGKISEENASIIIQKLLNATDYLHNKQICHRDIKPENIMFSEENNLNSIKLIDFGLSAQNLYNPLIDGYCGTFIYMSPEQIEKKFYSQTVDIWSIGIILYMLLNNNKHPFYIRGDDRKLYSEKIKKGILSYNNNLSFMAKNLINKLLEPNPSWRYTSDKALRHPWITRNKNDDIPKTFNEILSYRNNLKNGKYFLIMSIFLNYCKKNNELLHKKIDLLNELIYNKKIKKKKDKIYHIDNKYVNKCNYYSNKKKEAIKKEKFYSFDILDTQDQFNSKRNSFDTRLLNRNSIKNIKINNNVLFSNYKNQKSKLKLKENIIKLSSIKSKPKLLKEINYTSIKSELNIYNNIKNIGNNLEQKNKISEYIKTDDNKQMKKNKNIKEEKKNLSPKNGKIHFRISSNPLNLKNDLLPKVYTHKKVITEYIEEKKDFIPVILPKIPNTNRCINYFQIGDF